ncbi:hypothetical protein BsWGS_28595 [Bradybaena similaris]
MARRHPCPVIVSIFINFALVQFLTAEEFKYRLLIQCLDEICVRQDLGHFRSPLECASTCSGNDSSVAFSYTPEGVCLNLHGGCIYGAACAAGESGLHVYWKQRMTCQNSGQWNVQLQTCDCGDGWVGTSCERRPYSCKELKSFRYESKIHRVYIDVYRNLTRLAYTQCFNSERNSQTYIFRNDGAQSYNKTWTDYLKGFIIGDCNWWFGLENVRAFNRMGYRKIVFLIIVQPVNFFWEFGHENFTINDANKGFSFTSNFKYNTSYGTYQLAKRFYAEDLISMSQNVPFSTADMDRDGDAQNCAALHGAGWWFKSCSPGDQINPLGLVPKGKTTATEQTRIRLPGIETDNPDFITNYQTVILIFVE